MSSTQPNLRLGQLYSLFFERSVLFTVICRMLQSLNAPPAIPMMEVVITDIQSLLKTYPDPYLNPERTVIHFARCTALSDLLMKRVFLPQGTPYKFAPVPIITKWFSHGTPPSPPFLPFTVFLPLNCVLAQPGDRTSSSSTEASSFDARDEAHDDETAAILNMLRHDRHFRDEVKEMIRTVIRGQFDQLRYQLLHPLE